MDKQKIIDDITNIINEAEDNSCLNSYIGIGITTHDRYEIFKKTYDEIVKFMPKNSVLVVVDDCSKTPVKEADYRFNENAGIARAKNKCIELLYNKGCEHFFLMDDDCYPTCDNWYKPYIESGYNHLMYIFEEFSGTHQFLLKDTCRIYEDNNIIAYSHARGCMCYYRRICFDKVGGMSPKFGKWGYEHPDLSNRIYNVGLTPFKYMDVKDSNKLIYSRDEHYRNEGSTVVGEERQKLIKTNSALYDARKESTEYVNFFERHNIYITCYFTSLNDFQRDSNIFKKDKELIKPLINTIKDGKLIVLNDCFDDAIEGNVEYVKVDTGMKRVYFQRWASILQYLIKNKNSIENVFCIDGTDVEVLKSPFSHMDSDNIYTGDEAQIIGCDWMMNHNDNSIIKSFILEHRDDVLLNAGILGGNVDNVISYISKIMLLYDNMFSEYYFNNRADSGDSDMGIFNYVGYKYFFGRIIHGTTVNTVFKDNKSNPVSWFKHK